jgi:MFS family permease
MAGPTDARGTKDLRRNEAVLLGQGVSGGVATELTSVGLVLPFLYTTIGAPIVFAGLLVPLNTLSKRISQIFTARFVGTARSNARIIALATLTMAAAIVLISLTFGAIKPLWAVPVFLIVSAVLGAAAGVNGLAFQDLIGRALPKQRRSRLLFVQSGIAGVFVVIVAYGAQEMLRPGTSLAAHQELIWLGIGL